MLSDKIPLGSNGLIPLLGEQTTTDNQNVFLEGLEREKSFEISAKLPHLHHLCILSKQVYGMSAVVLKNNSFFFLPSSSQALKVTALNP